MTISRQIEVSNGPEPKVNALLLNVNVSAYHSHKERLPSQK